MSGSQPSLKPTVNHAAINQARVTWHGALIGMRLVLPLLPGILVFGAAFGTGAAHTGLSLTEAILSSGLVFAGAAQLVSLALWQHDWTLASILAITLVVFAINARMILMGAALHHWIKTAPPHWRWISLFVFTDANWIVGMRYHAEGGRDYGMFVGAGALLWLLWVLVTIPGYYLGSLIGDPYLYGLDMVMPIIFAAMLVPLWHGLSATGRTGLIALVPWLVAGLVALAVQFFVEGYIFIVIGALAGAVTSAVMPARMQA
jgi:predicted branched-subunit amino acid permease